jgi:DNA ligase D-like protein (predicted 3'-phosphoesterase)
MPKFAVQKHKATNLHYDFRLELDNAAKSWAIPKEPSADDSVKRLAVQVEDHEISYMNFEGRIPEGQYGAGTVELWDKGTFELESRKENKLVFRLNGKKLKGRFTLLKFEKAGEKSWLFFKAKEMGK